MRAYVVVPLVCLLACLLGSASAKRDWGFDKGNPMTVSLSLAHPEFVFTFDNSDVDPDSAGGRVASASLNFAKLDLWEGDGQVLINVTNAVALDPMFCQLALMASDVRPWDENDPDSVSWTGKPVVVMNLAQNMKCSVRVDPSSSLSFQVAPKVKLGFSCDSRDLSKPCHSLEATNVASPLTRLMGKPVSVDDSNVQLCATFALHEINMMSNSVEKFSLVDIVSAEYIPVAGRRYTIVLRIALPNQQPELRRVVVWDRFGEMKLVESKHCLAGECVPPTTPPRMEGDTPMLGRKREPNEEDVLKNAQFALNEINEKEGTTFTFSRVVCASSNVVAGLIYSMEIEVTAENSTTPQYLHMLVWDRFGRQSLKSYGTCADQDCDGFCSTGSY